MTSFRIKAMKASLVSIIKPVLLHAFNYLKPDVFSRNSFDNNFDDCGIPEGTFQTSDQARSVLMKSENLCKRVNYLAGKLGSNQISQDSYESLSSRVNLHIPKISVNDTPLSPLSMGELDTDRLNKIYDEEDLIIEFEIILKI